MKRKWQKKKPRLGLLGQCEKKRNIRVMFGFWKVLRKEKNCYGKYSLI